MRNIIKRIAALLAVCILTVAVGACAQAEPLTVTAMNGPTGMGIIGLDDPAYAELWNIRLTSSAEEARAAFIAGQTDIVSLPTNLAAVLYNKLPDDGVRMLAVNTLGVLYIVENGESIGSLADLKGKKLYATGQGSTPEYVIRWLLKENGLEDQVTLEFIEDHDTLATMLASGLADIAMLPEPKVTAAMMKNADLRVALDVTEEYEKTAQAAGIESQMSMGCVLTRQSVIDEHPEVIDAFLEAYTESVQTVNTQQAASAEIMAEKGIIPNAKIALQALPRCHIVMITGEEMKTLIAPFMDMLYASDPKSVGGALPGDDLYYIP